jgi:hypothetical protein
LRAASCLFGLYSVVALLDAGLPGETDRSGAVADRGKTEVAFSDAITAVPRQLWLEGVFEGHGQTEVLSEAPAPLPGRLAGGLGTGCVGRRIDLITNCLRPQKSNLGIGRE